MKQLDVEFFFHFGFDFDFETNTLNICACKFRRAFRLIWAYSPHRPRSVKTHCEICKHRCSWKRTICNGFWSIMSQELVDLSIISIEMHTCRILSNWVNQGQSMQGPSAYWDEWHGMTLELVLIKLCKCWNLQNTLSN